MVNALIGVRQGKDASPLHHDGAMMIQAVSTALGVNADRSAHLGLAAHWRISPPAGRRSR